MQRGEQRSRHRLGSRPAWWLSFVVLWLLLALWAASVPRLGGPDEPAHVLKAVAVARGDLSSRVDSRSRGGFGLEIPRTEVISANGYRTLLRQVNCWSGRVGVPTSCVPPMATETGPEVHVSTYVGTYPPAYYALVGWPTRAWSPEPAVLAARLSSAALVAALLASALASAGMVGRASQLAVLLALTPTMAYLGGVVNPSAAEAAAALALWSSALALLSQPMGPRRLVVRTAVAASVLACTRPLGPALVVGVVATTMALAAERSSLRALWSRRSVRWAVAGTVAATVAAAIHVVATDALHSVITSETGLDASGAARDAWAQRIRYVRESVQLISWRGPNQLEAPSAVATLWLAAVTALGVAALVVGRARHRLALVALAAAVLAFPVIAQASSPEVRWQGRYVLPLLLGLPVAAAWVLDRSARLSAQAGRWLVIAGAAGVALGLVVAQQLLMSRNLYGFPSAVFTDPAGAPWNGPLSASVLRVAAVVVAAAIVALAVALTWGPGGREDHADVVPSTPEPVRSLH